MEVTITPVSDVTRELEITTGAAELEPHFEKAYKEYRPKVEIKGFRKGKAPLDLVKKLYGDMIEHETLNSVASDLYREVVKEKELKPIGDPVIVDMDYKRGEQFRFKIQYDIRPEIVLKSYKGIEIRKPVHTVTDQDVEQELVRLRRIQSTTTEVNAVTDEEHLVTAEVVELDPSGVAIIGKKSNTSRFYLADPQLEAPIRNALQAATVGGEHRVTFDHTHDDHTHAVHLKLTVRKVEKVILPELDDDFVVKITKDKIKTVEEFRTSIREDLVAYWSEKSRRAAVNALVGEIVRRHDFAVPESLTRSVLQSLTEEVRNQYPNKQLPNDFDVEKF
ncbi:MAG: trigger factor, partial [Bacteroidota bacterium]